MYRSETNCQFIYEYCLFVLIFISMVYVLCEAIYRCLNFHGDTGDQYINGDSTIFDVRMLKLSVSVGTTILYKAFSNF